MLNESKAKDILSRENSNEDERTRKALKLSYRVKDMKEKDGEDYVNSHTDEELFESEVVIDDHIKATKVFKARAAVYTEKYVRENFEGKTDQEILTSSKNSPDVVKKSTHFKEKLRHLTKKDKSEKLGMESLKETLEALTVGGGHMGREQKKILAVSVTSMEYGVPELGLSSGEEKEVIEMKTKLMSGEEKVLEVPHKATRQVFPPGVKQIAQQHWEDITVVEPAKHRQLRKAVRDGEEITPSHYKTMTNDETYQSFKENCST